MTAEPVDTENMDVTREAVRPVRDAAPPPGRGVREPLRLALALFSVVRLPGPEPARADRRTLRRAVLLAPAVGLVLGLAGGWVVKLGRIAWTEQSVVFLAALGGLIVIAAFSGGRTFAGLAATADGLATSGRRPDQTRRGAPAGEAGPAGKGGAGVVARAGGAGGAGGVGGTGGAGGAGVAAVVFAVATQMAALQACIVFHRGTLAIVLATVAGRVAMVLACAGTRRAVPADPLAARLAGSVSPWVAGMMGLALMVAAGVAGRFDIDGGRARLGVHAVLAAAVALALALVTRWWLGRRFGGFTLATLGAVSEVASVAVLLVLAARLPEVVTIV